MKSKEIEQRLREIFADRLLMDVSDLVSYGFDASFGQYMPDYVVQVLSTEDVQNVVKLADEHIIPIYARGASTSLSGGALPVKGGIVVDFRSEERRVGNGCR